MLMLPHTLARPLLATTLALAALTQAKAQVGEYRNVFSVGISGGYAMNSVGFQPAVSQKMHGGYTAGLVGRYTSEKYFSTICAIQVEANLTQLGWTEKIETLSGAPVINSETGEAEAYKRDMTYVQIPFLAHLAWGRERNGLNFFVNLGPQIGFCLSEKTTMNYTTPHLVTSTGDETGRSSSTVAQETMPVENKFDYGIAFGGGIEWDIKHIGRFYAEGRYYYGLGNIYGDSKKDEFGKSNNGTINIKIGYIRDL